MTQTQTWVVDFLHMNTVHAIFCTEIFVYCRAIKQGTVLGLHVGVYSKDDTMAHTHRLVVTS